MAATILRPEINIPLELKPAYADWAEGKFGPQLKLKTQDKELVFLPLDTMNVLQGAGLLVEQGKDKDGNPAFRLTRKFTMTYTKRDKRPADIAIDGRLVSGDAPAKTPSGSPAVEVETPGWPGLALRYQKCATIARRVWGEDFDQVALVAATATLFIEANQEGLQANPKPELDRDEAA